MWNLDFQDELYHHGIKGQKWGIRRYQNEDGSLTDAGKKRYYNSDGTFTRKGKKEYYRPKRDAISNREIEIGQEYSTTKEGKKKLKAYEDAQDMLYDYQNTSYRYHDMPEDKVLAIFNKAEKDYFESEGRYVANKLINEIGREAFDTYVDYGSGSWMMNYKKHKDTIDAYVKNNYNAHGL